MRDVLYLEMFDDDLTSQPTAQPDSPIFDPLFEFQRSTGAAELLAAKLEHRHFVAEMLGTETISKRLREGLFDLTPSAVRPPVSPYTFVSEMPDMPEPLSDDEIREPQDVRLCDCKCNFCAKDDCQRCSADKKCARCEKSTKAVIAGMVGELRGRLYPHARNVSKAAWHGLEAAMLGYVTRAVSDVSL